MIQKQYTCRLWRDKPTHRLVPRIHTLSLPPPPDMSATPASELHALLEQVKAAARDYHTAELNRYLLRLCEERGSADSIVTVINMGATCVTEAIVTLLTCSTERSITFAHIDMIQALVAHRRELDRTQVMDVALKTGRYGLVCCILDVCQKEGTLPTVDYGVLLQNAVASNVTRLLDAVAMHVKDVVVLNAALARACESNRADMAYRLIEAGATHYTPALELFCNYYDREVMIYDLLWRNVKPTAACLNNVLKNLHPRTVPTTEPGCRRQVARIVNRLVQCGVPFPERDTFSFAVLKALKPYLETQGPDMVQWLRQLEGGDATEPEKNTPQ